MSLAEARLGLGWWIGHYGCGRLVKVAAEDGEERSKQGWLRPKAKHRLDCPACGYTHTVKVSWRRPRDEAEHEAAEVVL